MPTAMMTAKGQITIPAAIRDETGLTAGDRITFVREAKGRYVIVLKSGSIKSLKGIVPRPGKPVSLEDMQVAIMVGAVE